MRFVSRVLTSTSKSKKQKSIDEDKISEDKKILVNLESLA
jgi:hypothetical protein